MAKRAVLTTEQYLINAALPEATETYTVIPHKTVIDITKKALEDKGFEIIRELYRCNEGAQVAQGVYHINHGNDPDMGLMFTWSNSYDKSMRFKCTIGGFVHSSLASVIGGNMGSWGRKHTGTADTETFDTINEQIDNADVYFKQLVEDKDIMKTIPVNDRTRAEMMGRIYFINELVTGEQLSAIKQQFAKPAFSYGGVDKSLWSMYNNIIYVLQKAHPKTWMDQQRLTHWFLNKEFDVDSIKKAINPNQTNLIDAIAEVENIDSETASEVVEKFEEAITEELHEATLTETNDMLHGVDNDNAEVSIDNSTDEVDEEEVLISQEDVLSVAEDLAVELAQDEVDKILSHYPVEQRMDEGATWNFVVENLIYWVLDERAAVVVKTETVTKEELIDKHIDNLTESQVKELVAQIPENSIAQITADEEADDMQQNAVIAEREDQDAEDREMIDAEDNSWLCMTCNEEQGPNDVFHDGQLCTKCATK